MDHNGNLGHAEGLVETTLCNTADWSFKSLNFNMSDLQSDALFL